MQQPQQQKVWTSAAAESEGKRRRSSVGKGALCRRERASGHRDRADSAHQAECRYTGTLELRCRAKERRPRPRWQRRTQHSWSARRAARAPCACVSRIHAARVTTRTLGRVCG
eukprot:6173605-Pleurochrysis_carterae.AAC.4